MRSLLFALFLSLLAADVFAQASALPPEDGIWGDPSQSGSGFVIETNNRVMAVAAFAYDDTRQSTWYLGTGNYDYTAHRWSGTLQALAGGQCLGCTHSVPAPAGPARNLEIRFTSQTTANVFVDGVQRYSIQRSYFDAPNIDNFVLGEWFFSYPVATNSGILAGDDLLLLNEATCSNGPCTTGQRYGDLRPVTGQRSSGATYQVLLDSSPEFWTLYLVIPQKNLMRGSVFVFRKGTEPSQAAEIPNVHAVRIATRAGLAARGVAKGVGVGDAAAADAADAFYEGIWRRQVDAKQGRPSTTLMSDAELDAAARSLGAY